MGILTKIAIVTSGLTIFAGTAYITTVSLAPPPTYMVSNYERLQKYDTLAINNVYEKQTKGQEFYLGLTRWRRTLLRDEQVLRGRVLEVGAGCGTNVPYYCQRYMTEDHTVQTFMNRLFHQMKLNSKVNSTQSHTSSASNGSSSNSNNNNAEMITSEPTGTTQREPVNIDELLRHLAKYNACDEIILCDRAPNMVEACVRKVSSRLGYLPYRYPNYDVNHILKVAQMEKTKEKEKKNNNNMDANVKTGTGDSNTASKRVTVKRKVIRGDGSVSEVATIQDTDEDNCIYELVHDSRNNNNNNNNSNNSDEKNRALTPIAPILTHTSVIDAERIRLLSDDGVKELQLRDAVVAKRQQLHHNVLQFLNAKRKADRIHKITNQQHTGESMAIRNMEWSNNNNVNASQDAVIHQGNSWYSRIWPRVTSETSGNANTSMQNECNKSTDNNIITRQQVQRLHSQWEESINTSQPLFSVANYAAEQLPFADNSFDTVVNMFGLCSYDDPIQALQELSRVCKPDGKLLLIEHGKGHTRKINDHLDKWAPRHAKNWGCWWNRDIRRLIRLSGVVPEKWQNKHFGTSHYIIAKPYKTMEEWDEFYKQKHEKHNITIE